MKKHFGEKVLEFYFGMEDDLKLPAHVETIFPFGGAETQRVMKRFFEKYYADNAGRVFLFGINQGRLGAGVTGIGFSDGKKLEEYCGISNSFEKRSELSAEFIFEVIEAYGGVEKFYGDFYITSTSPVGFIKEGKNYNYYDDKVLERSLNDFILESIKKQLEFGVRSRDIICVGQGKNLKYLEALNKTHGLFGKIHTVPHPRWVMQYRRKEKEKHIARYLEVFERILGREKAS
ncbi:uracil-DNA glycosylase family protein [Sulfurovum mangrovi]|uniref:uracil-DNA glycosylase family protein n=1 Tax=Sulfurovum mangrovi TaxID=2893889 RepID=UPI001E56BA45|nr:uracil-DNA glycosylase family protein [Sulfurovum mangrovi]UFH60383.1 DUF4918 family protein [Sulfurovum mangrovi]